MHFRRSFIVLGMVVRLLEGTIITMVSQAEATSARSTTLIRTMEVKLTTASQTQATSARPTSLLRRIDVRRADCNVEQTTDVFERSTRKSRRYLGLLDELWKWDYWCMQQPETGNCGINRTKYYYNTQLDQCLPHLFTGCRTKNNKNQFESIAECENHCKGSALMPVNLPANTDICKLQPISGRCLGHITMYYYDINERECKTFVYGGCAGNENKFANEVRCISRCKSPNWSSNETQQFDMNYMINPGLPDRNTRPP